MILPAVPTVEPSSLIVKASTRTVEIPVLDAASTPINGPTKSNPMAPVAFVPPPSDTATPALIVTVAIPAATAASATTPFPTKLIVEILFAVPTIELSSRIVIPSIAPAGAEFTHCGAAPAPLDASI